MMRLARQGRSFALPLAVVGVNVIRGTVLIGVPRATSEVSDLSWDRLRRWFAPICCSHIGLYVSPRNMFEGTVVPVFFVIAVAGLCSDTACVSSAKKMRGYVFGRDSVLGSK